MSREIKHRKAQGVNLKFPPQVMVPGGVQMMAPPPMQPMQQQPMQGYPPVK